MCDTRIRSDPARRCSPDSQKTWQIVPKSSFQSPIRQIRAWNQEQLPEPDLLRVNSASTDIYFDHEVAELDDAGGFTVMYKDGPKRGLDIHFYSRRELDRLCADFEYIVAPYEQTADRDHPKTGTWSQWEAVLRRR